MPGAFTTHPFFLSDLLNRLKTGVVQLPDFQRGWVWDDDRIRGVLASVSRDFPIGAVMLLQTGGEARFKPRPVQGVEPTQVTPELLILDGQQRLTSLFQATLYGQVVDTMNARRQPLRRWYFIDIERALRDPENREDAFVSMPESGVRQRISGEIELDVSTAEKQYEAQYFPCNALFNPFEWQNGYLKHWNYAPARTELYSRFQAEVIQRFQQYQVPVITLTREVSKEAVCHVFEKVNTGGVVLTAFELLTATYAADNFPLRDDWYGPTRGEALGIQHALKRQKVLTGVGNTDFLQAVTLLHTFDRQQQAIKSGTSPDQTPAVSCTRASVLDLPLPAYKALRTVALEGFLAAGKFMREQSVYLARDLPYQTQLVPLAAILARLGGRWEGLGTKEKLSQWLWCGILGELYGSAIESRFARDLPEVLSWIDGGIAPTTVRDASFNPGRLNTLRTRNSAAYKGMYALLMRYGGADFRTGSAINFQVFEDEALDIHHIFPVRWCEGNRIDAGEMNCIVNKTAISASTNRSIGGRAPSKYLDALEKRFEISPESMNAMLMTHRIDATPLRQDDFRTFFNARRRALLDIVATAMGKPPTGDYREAEPYEEDEEVDDTEDEVRS